MSADDSTNHVAPCSATTVSIGTRVRQNIQAFEHALKQAVDGPMPISLTVSRDYESDHVRIKATVGHWDTIRIAFAEVLHDGFPFYGRQVVTYARHVNECREGIRDLVDQ